MSLNGGYRPVVLLMLVGAVVLGACQSDFASMDLSLDESRFGWKAQVEPDEPFGIDLYGNGAYPEAEWRPCGSRFGACPTPRSRDDPGEA